MKRYKKILVPVDGSKLSNLAFEQALDLAFMVHGEVTIIHVIEPSYYASTPFELTEIESAADIMTTNIEKIVKSMLDSLVQKGKKKGIKVDSTLIKGNIAHEIIEVSSNYDLIIMGSLGHSALANLFLGSVAEKVSRHACCPVMLVRELGKECTKLD